jgi:hypothetical protein
MHHALLRPCSAILNILQVHSDRTHGSRRGHLLRCAAASQVTSRRGTEVRQALPHDATQCSPRRPSNLPGTPPTELSPRHGAQPDLPLSPVTAAAAAAGGGARLGLLCFTLRRPTPRPRPGVYTRKKNGSRLMAATRFRGLCANIRVVIINRDPNQGVL